MESYKLFRDPVTNSVMLIVRSSDGAGIPLDLRNRDCRALIASWAAGAALQDADGTNIPYSSDALAALGLGTVSAE